MADQSDNPGGEQSEEQTNQEQPRPTGNPVMSHMMSNKVAVALWLTRIFTVVCTVLYMLPLFGGNPLSFYYRALISSAATSALRLHQRLPNFQLSREFLARLFLEDSCHYLLFSIIFINSHPNTMALVPVFLFGLLHASTYTTTILNLMGPQSMMFLRNMLTKLQTQQVNILRFIACNEIFLMLAIIAMMFSGKASLILPFVYYRFLTLRYSSQRNPYCRTLFSELRMTIEHLCNKPQCPQIVRNITNKGISLITRLAPAVNPPQ
ncbi:transmembrane protein 33-like [Gigantopelta aegis]|uniref:transmembrane protein 33-like n=1 Tax=Gigantopelta aegis TaxID=1735272 RepID=UPI001B88AA1E|nr:transmembrane protein 33-like [Gigantopelta aegis]XP_041358061.1 transmembrane protein 33-like [Gigantopelta aegis]XP_041358062.1 transmembrane protein 33-like [Gigantopelta aegis]XP_041358063.1 transmembrane protein 33-like [Gigantopelta aegis]